MCFCYAEDLRSSSDEFDRQSQDEMRRLKRNRIKEKDRPSPANEKADKPITAEKGHDRLNGRYHDSDRESEDRHSLHSDKQHGDRRHQEWDQGKSPDRRLHDKQNNIAKHEADIQHSSPHDRRRDQPRPEYARNSPHGERRAPPDHRPPPRDDYDRRNRDYDTRSLDRRGPRPSDPHSRKAPPHGEHDPRTREADRRRSKTPSYDSRSLPPDEIRRHNPRFPHEWHDDLNNYNSKGETERVRPSYYRGPATGVHSKITFSLLSAREACGLKN